MSESLKISPDRATELAKNGAALLCLELPEKTLFGIDYLTFEIGDQFKGVKMIPPGPHFIHTCLCNDNYNRMGFFLWLNLKQVNSYLWQKDLDCMIAYPDKEQAERLQQSIDQSNNRKDDRSFIPNRQTYHKRICGNSTFIKEFFLCVSFCCEYVFAKQYAQMYICVCDNKKKVEEEWKRTSGKMAMCEEDSKKEEKDAHRNERDRRQETEEEAETNRKELEMHAEKTSRLDHGKQYDMARFELKRYHPYYCNIPSVASFQRQALSNQNKHKQKSVSDSNNDKRGDGQDNESQSSTIFTASQLTKLHMDRTPILKYVLEKLTDESELLAEMQYSFVCFLIGRTLSGLEQWKRIVDLLCNCEEGVELYKDLYLKFIRIISIQLKELPDDFFTNELTSTNFLNKSLHNLMQILSETQMSKPMSTQVSFLKTLLLQKFQKNFDATDDEDQPIVVQLP
ncbi:hypothetical protein RFI_09802 [Reticulomyxa filosa]|uniref:AAR2 splicing factor homolog n=1 Tax=Reticulomyxa filosa TaxID=46433 RepID=X6NM30_RETFI|nr:hypothetical protein RFI_09802 [Reticulomyxa filosa]|eukprot:ETO27330.1 hypothetical protein RFI_09802 [Reticulomyxa filosa]